MKQIAKNLTDCEDGFLNGGHYPLMDRDGKFMPELAALLEPESVQCVKLPPRSLKLKAHFERFMG